MYKEYLMPDVVLFGQFANPSIKCQQPHIFKQGQIIVHQSVKRAMGMQMVRAILEQQASIRRHQQEQYENYENDEDYEDIEGSEHEYVRAGMQQIYQNRFQEGSEDDYYEEEEQQNYESVFNKDSLVHPLGHQLRGVQVRADLLPYELSNIISPQAIQKKRSQQIPFSHSTVIKKGQQEEEDYDEEESWITQDETEEYVINQQLQEVSGAFGE